MKNRMKRKEIAEYLDEIGTLVANAKMFAYVSDSGKVSEEQSDAALIGLSVGIALGSGIISGEYKTNSPIVDAAHAIGAMMDVISEHSDD